jgi:hypothetical protein
MERLMDPASVPEVRRSAEELSSSGLFFAESVVLAIAEAQGAKPEVLPILATAYCSGMARSCGTRGALPGAMMGVGLALGRSTPSESVQPCYAATRRVIEESEQEFGSRDRAVLLDGCDLSTANGRTRLKEQELGLRRLIFTGMAAEIAARVISESGG